MSIEWLLIKNKEIEAQRKTLQSTQKEKDCTQINQMTGWDSSSSKVPNLPFEIELHCDCGYEGTVVRGKTDFKFIGKGKKNFAYFECPNCKRHLRYDCSTGKIKIKKGVFGFKPLRSR